MQKESVYSRSWFQSPVDSTEDPRSHFVLSHRHIPLSQLSNQLSQHADQLQQSLVDWINSEYGQIVQLPRHLQGVEQIADFLMQPINELKQEAALLRDHFQAKMDDLKSKMAKKQQLRQQREALQRLLDVDEAMKQLEQQFAVFDPASMDRMAQRLNQLDFLVSQSLQEAHSKDFVEKHLQSRLNQLRETIQTQWEALFLQALQSRDASLMERVLFASHQITQGGKAMMQQWLSLHVLNPYLEEHFSKTKYDAFSQQTPLLSMFEEFISWCQDKQQPCAWLLDCSQEAVGEACRNDFIFHILESIANHIMEHLGSLVMSPAIPAVFHRNYVATHHLYDTLGQWTGIAKEQWPCPSFQQWFKKWPLSVYFQLRTRQLLQSVEQKLNDKDNNEPSFQIILNAIDYNWHKDQFLLPLLTSTYQTTLQLMARYCLWLQQVMESLKEDKERLQLFKDVVQVTHHLDQLWHHSIHPVVPEETRSTVRSSYERMTNDLMQSCELLLKQALITQCTQKWTAALPALRTLPSLYRHTQRPAPTEPSAFMSALTAPCEALLEQSSALEMTVLIQPWMSVIWLDLIQQYSSQVQELLQGVQKTEQSLRRLKKATAAKRQGTATATETETVMTDDDKIREQCWLDVQWLADKIVALGAEENVLSAMDAVVSQVRAMLDEAQREKRMQS